MTNKLKIVYSNPGVNTLNYLALSALLHAAFQEREEQNLHFSCANLTPDKLKDVLSNKYVFVAYDSQDMQSGSLVGMATLEINEEHGHIDLVAVNPSFKRGGVATQLFSCIEKYARQMGEVKFFTSTTACDAKSSVNWHKKWGLRFMVWEMIFRRII